MTPKLRTLLLCVFQVPLGVVPALVHLTASPHLRIFPLPPPTRRLPLIITATAAIARTAFTMLLTLYTP